MWEELNPSRVTKTGSAPTYFAQFRLLLGSGSEKGHFLPFHSELEQAEGEGHKCGGSHPKASPPPGRRRGWSLGNREARWVFSASFPSHQALRLVLTFLKVRQFTPVLFPSSQVMCGLW